MSTESQADTTAEEPKDVVWVEKYRPQTIEEIVGQEDITRQLAGYVEKGELPNLLFSGEAGIGKTTSAVCLAMALFGDDWQDNFLELNASDDRGIDVVRDRIKDFARTSFGGYDHRIIFLDEADSLTDDAQAALRRTMEQFSNNVRFIMSCNYSNQIIDPIQSRCSVFRYSAISDDVVAKRLREIADLEDVEVTEDGIEALVYTANGDMRRAINALQGAAVLDRAVDEDAVYQITSTPRPEEIESMIQSALSGEYHQGRMKLDELLTNRGLSGSDILTQVHRLIWEFDVSDEQAIEVMDRVGESDYRITEGSDDRIQLEALLAGIAKSN
jgi:replication factor C small subunit